MGFILLLPYALLILVAWLAIRYSVKGGSRRLVGILGCPMLGAICFGLGWWMAYVGFPKTSMTYVAYPVAGWIGMVAGSVCLIFGTIYSMFGRGGFLKEFESSIEEANGSEDEASIGSQNGQILYIGDSTTSIYHERSCLFVDGIKPENTVMFRSAYEAEKAGYTFCDLCQSKENT